MHKTARHKHHDSAEWHVQGNAAYIDDVIEPVGLLHLAPGYGPSACGKITAIDLDAVYRAEGVVTVLTADDIKGVNDCSPAMGDDLILAEDEVIFHGQVIFAVVATSRTAARKAAKLANIEIDTRPPSVTIGQARQSGETVLPPYKFQRGNVDEEISAAENSISGDINIGGQEHFYLEGQVAMASPREGGGMHVLSSTQHPSEVQHCIARMLDVDEADVVCEIRRMGGAFGGKESQAAQWAALAALAASKTGQPAKMRLDRDDDMIMTGKRHDFQVEYQAGFNNSGILTAIKSDLYARCGCSADLSLGVNDRAMFHADNAYYYPVLEITSHRLKTNTVSNTAFRGFGGPQGMVFAERLMDEIACRLGIDPLDVRKRNLYGPKNDKKGRDVTPYNMQITDNIAPAVLRSLEKSSDYRARRKAIKKFNRQNTILKKGIALTPVKFGISFTLIHLNQAGALVHVYTDGSVQINHGGTEMGQGLYSKVASIVANEFGIAVDKVKITATTTEKVPNTAPTAASAGSDLNGMAAQNACQIIKKRLSVLAAKRFSCQPGEVEFANAKVFSPTGEIAFAELAKQAFLERVSLSSTGFYATPKISWDRENVSGTPFFYFAYGAACSEVTIDTMTGEMRIDQVDILHDVGTSLNPAIDIGQIEGGFVQGMGWLTTEELVYDQHGRLTTHAPSTYKIPTATDVPEKFRVELWPSKGNKAATIYRSKAVGEPPVMLALSVFSAIFDAVASLKPGTVPKLDAPATPEAIIKAVNSMEADHV
ncbi:Xanthine dehydrogenase, molybdenum binding subunit [hydrothermal vent metagenome]|uniref:Xanthine dehydrogenase, molybdenum binding subunit n=1 Tax=hydrothermal vent metagenome TaxID=652676 RepID=A0A3B0SAT7_9ZZZZ